MGGVFFEIKGRKLYIRSGRSKGNGPAIMIRDLMMEQDTRSPHRYFSDRLHVREGDIFIDCGAAEGLITLGVIDKVKHAYLFESEKDWNNALVKTFHNENKKTAIINKYVSDCESTDNETLEKYIRRYPPGQRIVIKMDIEGMEGVVLKDILAKCSDRDDLCFAVCTYHKPGDAEEFEHLFKSYGYKTEFSKGYMVFGHPREFRKGIIRAWKE